MSTWKTYRTEDYQTWDVDGKSFLLTEGTTSEAKSNAELPDKVRQALLMAPLCPRGYGVGAVFDFEKKVEDVTGMSCLIVSLNEILLKEKEQSENEAEINESKIAALMQKHGLIAKQI